VENNEKFEVGFQNFGSVFCVLGFSFLLSSLDCHCHCHCVAITVIVIVASILIVIVIVRGGDVVEPVNGEMRTKRRPCFVFVALLFCFALFMLFVFVFCFLALCFVSYLVILCLSLGSFLSRVVFYLSSRLFGLWFVSWLFVLYCSLGFFYCSLVQVMTRPDTRCHVFFASLLFVPVSVLRSSCLYLYLLSLPLSLSPLPLSLPFCLSLGAPTCALLVAFIRGMRQIGNTKTRYIEKETKKP
jgi:hypothetical protein